MHRRPLAEELEPVAPRQLAAALPLPVLHLGQRLVQRALPGKPVKVDGRKVPGILLGGNACVDDQIAAYLADGTLPPRQPGRGPDAICAPLPQPEPEVQAASASAGSAAALRLRLKLVPR